MRSVPAAPRIDSPTGPPSTVATGRLICGKPDRPAMQVPARMRSRSASISGVEDVALGRGEGRGRQAPARRRGRAARPCASSRPSRVGWLASRCALVIDFASARSGALTSGPKRGLVRSTHAPVGLPRPRRPCRGRKRFDPFGGDRSGRPAAPPGRRSPLPSLATWGGQRVAHRGVGAREQVGRDQQALRRLLDVGARQQARRRRASRSGHRARSRPTVSKLTASGMTPFSEMRPCVGLIPNSPQKLDGMRNRAAGVGAERGVDQAAGGPRRPSRSTSRRARGTGAFGFGRRAVMRVAPQQAERQLVGVGLADQGSRRRRSAPARRRRSWSPDRGSPDSRRCRRR